MHQNKVYALWWNLGAQKAAFRNNVVQASFMLSELIGKKLKSHSEAEFLEECLQTLQTNLLSEKTQWDHSMERNLNPYFGYVSLY